MHIVVGDVVVLGPALTLSALGGAKAVLESRFRREGAPGRLVVQLRPETRFQKGFEVMFAYVENGDMHSVRNEVRDALGLQPLWLFP
jgi:hypothetical protein